MSTNDDPQHRAYHQPDPTRVTLREEVDSEDGVFSVRMPLASTGEVRNEGDEPLTEEELRGMAEQVNSRGVGVFLDHGTNMDIGGSRYSAVGKVGEWEDAAVSETDDELLLEADARMMDPETLPAASGSVREALAALKSQVERNIALSSSIGWRDDESMAGGVDLMEASIVGIPADPRTSQHGVAAMARAATEARPDADPSQLVADFRAVVMGPDNRAVAPNDRHLSAQQAETATRLLDAYRDRQGNGSVENFESWLWNVAYHEFDEDEFHAAETALQEFYRETTPLEEPVGEQFVPFLSGQDGGDGDTDEGSDARDSVTDTDTTQSGDDPDNTNDDQDDIPAAEFRSEMLEMQRQQTETLSTLAEALREDGMDDEDDEDDEEDDDDEDRALDVDGEKVTAAEVREMREQLPDADVATDEDEDASERDAEESSDDQSANPKNLLKE